MYKPGLHIISEFQVENPEELCAFSDVKNYFDSCIKNYGLEKVGEVYHAFSGGGYTAVVCLTESHISIHTWPEFNKVTFDVFLSNYKKENEGVTVSIHDGLLKLMLAINITSTQLKR